MAIPTWVPGQILNASDVNSWFVPLAAIKPADTGRTSTASITADPDLQLPVAANAAYLVSMGIWYNGINNNSTGGIQWSFTGPAGCALRYSTPGRHNVAQSIATPNQQVLSDVVSAGTFGTGVSDGVHIHGLLNVSSTSGTLVWQWAQATSVGTTLTVQQYSFMFLARIG